MKKVIHPRFKIDAVQLSDFIRNFDDQGEQLGKANRNSLKIFELGEKEVLIKSFKIPNLINQIAYKFLRKSKARRSYEFALKLLEKGIRTPQPVAFFEYSNNLAFRESFYISEKLNYDLTYRQLVREPDYPEHEKILRAFTRFTYELHENKVLFKDHSPGNTLIKKEAGEYLFYLVDLNRMDFKDLNFQQRMQNFARLTPKKEMVQVMSDEYAKLTEHPFPAVFQAMWGATQNFQEKFQRKRRFKKRFKLK